MFELKCITVAGSHIHHSRSVTGTYRCRVRGYIGDRDFEAMYINRRLRIKIGCGPWRSPAWYSTKGAFDLIERRNRRSYATFLAPLLPGLIAVIASLFNQGDEVQGEIK